MQDHPEGSPETLRLRAGGMTFTALAWGPPDGPLALCLHGYPDTAWTWRHLGPYLGRRGWRVVAPYLRGYAPTDLAPDGCYELGALARDVEQLHARLSGDERAVLIGHDWGAAVAYILAAGHAGPFRRIVTLAIPPPRVLLAPLRTPWRLPRLLPLAGRQLLLSWYMYFNLVPRLPELVLPRLIPWLWDRWSPGYDARADLAEVEAALDTRQRCSAALSYYRALFLPWRRRPGYAPEFSRLLRAPRVPLLYLHGARDGCVDARATRLAGSVLAPDRIGLVPGAGHFLHLEQPEAVNERIARFI